MLYRHKVVIEKKERRWQKKQKKRACCWGKCSFRRDRNKWSLRRRLRFVVATTESILDGMSILVAFMLSALLKMSYDLHHAIAEHNPCQEIKRNNRM